MSHHNTFLHDVIAQVLSKSFVDHHGEALNSLAESAKLIACGKQSSGYTRLALIYGPVVATAKDNAVARRLTITVNIGRNRKSGVMSGNVRLGISHFTGDESRADDLATVRIVMGESGVWQLGKANVAGRPAVDPDSVCVAMRKLIETVRVRGNKVIVNVEGWQKEAAATVPTVSGNHLEPSP